MEKILQYSIYFSIPIFIIFGFLIYNIGMFTIRTLRKRGNQDEFTIPLGGFIGTVATAWGLSLGFVASDIWNVNSMAIQAVSSERSAISRLLGAASPQILNAPGLEKTLIDYRNAVINDEWRENMNVAPAASVENALQDMRRELIRLSRGDIPSPIMSQLISDANSIQNARNSRLAIGSTSIDSYKWYLMLILTLLTTTTIATTHADRVAGGRKALLIYSTTASLCLWILAIHANPYHGAGRLKPNFLLTDVRQQAGPN